jgi:hypothetical protein
MGAGSSRHPHNPGDTTRPAPLAGFIFAMTAHGADYAWVCIQCFDDLRGQMGWTAAQD